MSVINQMLNDLQQREQQKQQQGRQVPGTIPTTAVATVNPAASVRNLVLAVLLTLITCGAGFFIWQLSTQNEVLKQALADQASSLSEGSSLVKEEVNRLVPAVKEKVLTTAEPTENKASFVPAEPLLARESSADEAPAVVDPPELMLETAIQAEVSSLASPLVNTSEKMPQQPSAKLPPLVENPPRLAISRKQVSADELVLQKRGLVEQAINAKQLPQAEVLLEDILILQPEHEQSRKQLAALWFGRQAYQAAINVLSQGLSLAPDNGEFRLMQAKIYLSQGLKEKAYQVLQVLATTEDKEYLAGLANAAQQTGRYQQASELYQKLTRSQPGLSRWWLGLGVAHDSNSQFELAIAAYRYALAQGNLSMSSTQFARQRLQQLGGDL